MDINYTDVYQKNFIEGRAMAITGAGSGFGRLMALEVAKMGGNVVISDIDEGRINETAAMIKEIGKGKAVSMQANAACREDVAAMVKQAVDTFGKLDVFICNAGTMPLAPWECHAAAMKGWENCIDVNLKGTMYGIAESYDQMISQGHGQIVSISSIYGNFPVNGSGVYQATKIGVRYLAESLRVESQGKIKTTIVNPTGISTTNINSSVVDARGAVGIYAQNYETNKMRKAATAAGTNDPDWTNQDSCKYTMLKPEELVWGVMFALNQPWGVSVSDVTMRSSGELFIL